MALREGDVDGLLKGPAVEGVGIACFEWQHKDGKQPYRGLGWRRRISIVCLIRRTHTRVSIHGQHCWDWELIDLRHGGTYEIGNLSFFWHLPIVEFSTWQLTKVMAVYTHKSGLHLKDALRSWLGPAWDKSVALMEFLSQEDGNEILAPGDHCTYTGVGNLGFHAREAAC
jgi:hypothetical protein